MIKLNEITKYYKSGFGTKTYALDNVSLQIDEGEFVTIMGPSGSGKSTLLHIIGMLDTPTTGEYIFMDQPVHKMKEKQRSELHKKFIGFVFQSYHLIDDLTVFENLETPLLYQGVRNPERKDRIEEVLEKFKITDVKAKYPNSMSGGIQQLVGIARAVIISPKLILADEPTGNLNSEQGDEIMELFEKLHNEGTTIMQVTHSEKNASYSKRVIEILDGGIVGKDTKVGE